MDQSAFILKNKSRELDSTSSNYLQIKLKRTNPLSTSKGATVRVFSGNSVQTKYAQTSRGFQSSVEEKLHFGLGNIRHIDSVIVTWPNQKLSTIKNIDSNQVLTITDANAFEKNNSPDRKMEPLLSAAYLVDHEHKESPFNDFRIQSLLQQGYSNQGPGLAVADVNGDGLDDFFFGGAYGYSGYLYIQNAHSGFSKTSISSEKYEDVEAIFFDADNDGDKDLYVTSGGSERYAGHELYQDRFYLNDGTGNFSQAIDALPEMFTSTSTVVACDFDLDGDLDLFVGGRIVPGKYPTSPQSYLLENTGGTFINITKKWSKELENIGMVTSAVWLDVNEDNRPDLIVAGEFMPVSIFQNTWEGFVNITEQSGLGNTHGMWTELIKADIDQDGDMDLVAGNMGLNHGFNISQAQPLQLHYADFDNNGTIDPIFSAYEEGKPYPITSLDLLSKQLPILKKKLLRYNRFAATTTPELLEILNTEHQTMSSTIAASVLLENTGNGQFSLKNLPLEAQFAPLNSMLAEDINGDGLPDLMIAGNNYGKEVVKGRQDASIGYILINKGGNTFKVLSAKQSGLVVKGDARNLTNIKYDQNTYLLAAQNNSQLLSFKFNSLKEINEAIEAKNTNKPDLITQTKKESSKVETKINHRPASGTQLSIIND